MKPKYKLPDTNCSKCRGSGYEYRNAGGDAYHTFYDKIRCSCTKIETQEYLNSKRSEESNFYDNNSRFTSSYAMDSY